jgi:hypothetical protein
MESDGIREAPEGTWQEWKRSFAAFLSALGSLGFLRWEMAKSEAKEWGRFALVRTVLFATAAALSFLALVFLLVGIVLLLDLWFGSLLGAVFACFGICVLSAAGLLFAALRSRLSRSMFERTAGEIRKDFESWTGEGQ